MARKIKMILLFSLLVTIFSEQASGQQSDTISGRLYWSLDFSEFSGYYNSPDSLLDEMKDTLLHYYSLILIHDAPLADSLKTDYQLLERAGLLFSPLQHIINSNGESLRIFFNESDYEEILKSNWFSNHKIKKEKTYITVLADKIGGNIFFCKQLISVETRK